MKFSFKTRCISFVIIVSMLVTLVPTYAFADEVAYGDETFTEDTVLLESEEEDLSTAINDAEASNIDTVPLLKYDEKRIA